MVPLGPGSSVTYNKETEAQGPTVTAEPCPQQTGSSWAMRVGCLGAELGSRNIGGVLV